MHPRLGAVFALTLLALPAAAQPAKGKKPPPAKEPKKEEPKVEKKPEPEPEPEPPPKKPEPKVAAAAESDKPKASFHGEKGTHLGATLLLGPVFSTSNASKSLKLIWPAFTSVGLAIDGKIDGGVFYRIEPSISYFRRKSSVRVVRKVDASDYPDVKITTEDITNRVNLFDLTARLMIGYDFTPAVSARVGGVVGLGTAATGADACSSDNRVSSLVYGGILSPFAYRVSDGGMTYEVGLAIELRSQRIPRCDVPLKGEFNVNAGEVASFTPKVVDQQLTVVVAALQGTLFF